MRGKTSASKRVVVPTEHSGVACWFGATSVGVLLDRMRLHLGTQRFLAARRGDRIWEASCDYAALSLERLESRLRPGTFGAPLFPAAPRRRLRRRRRGTANPRTLSGNRKGCGTRQGHRTAVVARPPRRTGYSARRSWKSPASEDAGYSNSSRTTAGRLRPAKQAAGGDR